MLGVAAGIGVVPGEAARATTEFKFTRFAGQHRFDTAAKIAQGSEFGAVTNVVMATGDNFPDALAGSYLAGALTSPILLTRRDSLPSETTTVLAGLQAKSVTLLGGTSAISGAVEDDLRRRGLDVRRVAGTTRYETAAAAARQAALAAAIGTVASKKTAFVATGEAFADALAAGPASFAGKLPILLTTRDSLSAPTKQAIQDLKIEQVIILGGTNAVGVGAEGELRSTPGVTGVARIVGADRTQTATGVAQFALDNLGFTDDHINLARGDDFADALAGGPHGGRELGVTLLAASSSNLDNPTNANSTFLRAHAATLETGHIFGGTAALAASVEQAALAAAGAAPPEAPAGTHKSVKVREVAGADDYFVSAAGLRYNFDAGDAYQFSGNATSMTATTFEAMLNPDDVVDVTYAPGGASTFNLTNDIVHPAAPPTMRYSNTAGNTVDITVTFPADNSPGTTYTVQLVRVIPGCGGQPSADAQPISVGPDFTQPTSETSRTVTIRNVGPFNNPQQFEQYQPGCYVPSVVASSPLPSTARGVRGSNGNELQLPAPPGGVDLTAPRIDRADLTDTSPTVSAGKGDIHTFSFDEVMSDSSVASGAGYRLVDADNTTIDVICNQNATCTKDDNNVTQAVPPVQYSKITVTLTVAPTPSGGSIAGFAYKSGGVASTVGSVFGWADDSGNAVDLSGSADKSLP